ncbi:MAG TPA: Na/Pi cotransporter family protein [Syntrophales bacterium]|nr:Na/Pi cotransporter family protein [Syntrophales bacterium]
MEGQGRLGAQGAGEALTAMTWIREILLFAAGITIFLYGTMRLSEEVQTYLSSLKVRRIFRFAVHNPFYGLLTGICSTVLLQSSTATSVLVVGMVSAGLMSFYRSLGIILGADIGTTLTVQLIVWKVTAISPLIVFSGGTLWFFGQERWKKIGEGILYFGFIFFGLELVTMATAPLGQSDAFREMIKKADHPVFGLLIGLATASLVHSSAIPIGILVILAQHGLITLEHALPVVFGANVGTAVTALLASLVANINGKRSAVAHFLFKLTGALVCTALLSVFQGVVMKLSAGTAQQVALGHLLFNVVIVALFIFILRPASYLVEYLLPGSARTLPIWPEYLDERCLSNPEEALNRVRQELKRQMVLVESNCSTSMELISRFDVGKARDASYVEFVIDNLRREVGLFLRKLSSGSLSQEQTKRLFAYSGMADDIERIADHAMDVIKLARSKQHADVCFTSWAEAELNEIMGYVRANLAEVVALLDDMDAGRVKSIFEREDCVDRLVRDARDRHIERFNRGVCQAEAGPVFVEILLRIERMSDHCENIAEYARDLR